ncbi:MAG: LysM peptidoglycan-binding domain-containing protein [Anaerolineae bacterium]|nr:LysM peptidoglycan-binding domain-containing protein [Anaerolineae bacterium]MCX8067298.1 LysM peptidoglycan-binding domain-containing protein [Anaerolineae bacterium]
MLLIVLSAAGGILLLALSRKGTPAPVPAAIPTLSPTPTPTLLPSPLPEASPTPELVPLRHVVQPGETLFSIATTYGVSLAELIEVNQIQNPNLIRPGEVLIIPGRTVTGVSSPGSTATPGPPIPLATAPPRPALPTLTPSGTPAVEIAAVLGAGDLAREVVRLRNRGGTVSLEGWSLSDATGNQFVFPRLILFPGTEVTLHSGPGESTPTRLYWGRTVPAWQSGELLTLRDEKGQIRDTYVVP